MYAVDRNSTFVGMYRESSSNYTENCNSCGNVHLLDERVTNNYTSAKLTVTRHYFGLPFVLWLAYT